MEKKNRRTLILSVMICLLPMILGLVFYDKLPEQMPIHFNINNIPDKYASKNLALFGIPLIMASVQIISILTTMNKLKDKEKPKFIKVMEWFIPTITVVLYIMMLGVPMGGNVHIRHSVTLVLGILFIIIGNFIHKMSYDVGKEIFHPMPKSEEAFRKMSKITGWSFSGIGIVCIILNIFI